VNEPGIEGAIELVDRHHSNLAGTKLHAPELVHGGGRYSPGVCRWIAVKPAETFG
jgi:hypothetical protein